MTSFEAITAKGAVIRTEYEIWRDEIATPKLTVAQRVAKWFDRAGQEPSPNTDDADADMFRWWSLDELTGGRAAK